MILRRALLPTFRAQIVTLLVLGVPLVGCVQLVGLFPSSPAEDSNWSCFNFYWHYNINSKFIPSIYVCLHLEYANGTEYVSI